MDTTRKRKRSKNTAVEQYEIYLQFMENDYVFRSGTINPTVSDDYIEHKWEDLTNRLNSVGDGPCLSTKEWKKRFDDWKYITRGKYRKLKAHQTTTGAGPPTKIKISDLEERALSVWGLVCVTGANVTEYEGINISTTENVENNDILMDGYFNLEEENEPIILEITETPSTKNSINEETYKETSANKKLPATEKTKQKQYRPKPLSLICESLINSADSNNSITKSIQSTLKDFTNNYISLERERLRFEVDKYKYENPTFQFDLNYNK